MAEWTGTPAYLQIAADLRRKAADMQVGDKLPSHNALAKEHRVSTTVAKEAIGVLVTEGIVVTHQGKGTFVRQVPALNEDGAVDPQPSGFDAVMRQLGAMKASIDDLTTRVAELERAQDSPPATPMIRSARSGQR